MPNYLCLQRDIPGEGPPEPPDMTDMQARFAAWMEKFARNLPDMGGQLGAGKVVSSSPSIDGPFVEVRELAGGYMIVSADSLEEAATVAGECPGLVRLGSGVEVIEIRTA